MAKIVIVEDTKNVREIISFMLRNRGHEVLEAKTGTEGYDIIKKNKPDIIILDIMLPGMDGFEICSSVKGDSVLKNCKVVILSAVSAGSNVNPEELRKKVNADMFLVKPFKAKELLDAIDHLLDNRA